MSFQQTSYLRTTTHHSSSIPLSQFVSPEQMLQRLISTDLPKCQCPQSSPSPSHTTQQQLLLQNLISQYKIQISARTQELIDAERLLEIRDRLYMEMDQLKKERSLLEMNITNELHSLQNEHQMRMTGIKSQSASLGQQSQLIHIKQTNNKLRLRLKDLLDYITRMQTYNQRLQMSRTTLPPRVQPTTDHVYKNVIREEKIYSRLAEQDDYTRRMEERIRRMEEEARDKVRVQEEEIHKRNLERVNQIRMMQEMGGKSYVRSGEVGMTMGNSRGFYEGKVFFPDQGMYGAGGK